MRRAQLDPVVLVRSHYHHKVGHPSLGGCPHQCVRTCSSRPRRAHALAHNPCVAVRGGVQKKLRITADVETYNAMLAVCVQRRDMGSHALSLLKQVSLLGCHIWVLIWIDDDEHACACAHVCPYGQLRDHVLKIGTMC